MSEKHHNIRHVPDNAAGRRARPVDQDHRDPELARGIELCPRAAAARVLGDDMGDAVILQQRAIASFGERAARDHCNNIGQRQRTFGRVDQAQEVMVLRLRGETREVLLADGKEYAGRDLGQGGDGGLKIRNMGPVISVACLPRRAFIGAKRRAGFCASRDSVPAHLGREGMRRVDDVGYALGPQVVGKPLGAAEAADAGRQRLRDRRLCASSVGKNRVDAAFREMAGKVGGLGCSAQKKDAGHG